MRQDKDLHLKKDETHRAEKLKAAEPARPLRLKTNLRAGSHTRPLTGIDM